MVSKDDPLSIALHTLSDFKALACQSIDVRQQSELFDTMVIACGNSGRHTQALAHHVAQAWAEHGFKPFYQEHDPTGQWIILEYAGTVLHLMQPETRAFYDLEGLWWHEDETLSHA